MENRGDTDAYRDCGEHVRELIGMLEREYAPPVWGLKRRRRSPALLVLIGMLLPLTLVESGQASQDQHGGFVISQTVNLVELPVTVRDHQGQFVSGLDQSNFQVFEDGKPQEITLFRKEDVPVAVALVVDHSGSMIAKHKEVFEGESAFIEASNPLDREFVVNFSESLTFGLPPGVPYSGDLEELRTALFATPPPGKTAMYDAVSAALQHFQKNQVQADRKVLLLMSDGGDNASRHSFSEVLRMAQSDNIVIYAIGLFDKRSADKNPGVLQKLSDETGGEVYFPKSPQEVVSVCQQVAADIRHQYTLGYNPPDPEKDGYRKVEVKEIGPHQGKLLVRTRSGYYLPAQSAPEASPANR